MNGSEKFDKSPKGSETKEFWSKIWSVEGRFNEEAGWLKDVSEKFDRVEDQAAVTITASDVKKAISRMANWKALCQMESEGSGSKSSLLFIRLSLNL